MGNTMGKDVASVFLQVMGWVVAIGGGAYGVHKEKDAEVLALIVGTGLMTVLLAQLDKFEFLKGLGIELKVRQVEQARREVEKDRERVEQIAVEAKGALEEAKKAQADTRDVAQQLVAATLRDLAGATVWGGAPTLPDTIATRDRLVSLLERVGASRSDIHTAATPFNNTVRLILASRCVDALARIAQKDEKESIRAMKNFKAGVAPTTEELVKLRRDKALESDEVVKAFAALSQFEQTSTIPRDYDAG